MKENSEGRLARLYSGDIFFRAMVDELPDSIAIIDQQGVILHVNQTWNDAAIGNGGDLERLGPTTNYLEACQRAIDGGGDGSRDAEIALHGIRSVFDDERRIFEFTYPCHSDNAKRWYKLRAKKIVVGGKPYCLTSHVDITDQKLAEERFRVGFQSLTAGSVVIDQTGTVLMFNAAAEEIFEYPRTEVLGQNVRMLMPASDRERHDSYLEKYAAGGGAKIIGVGREVVGRRKNGAEFPMHLGIGQIDMPDGVYFIGAITDLSKLKQAHEQVAAALEEANRANAAKTYFLASMSHEIRTPLNAIIGFAEALEMGIGIEDPVKRAESLGSISSAARQLNSLLVTILDSSKIESDQIVFKPVEVLPSDLLREYLPIVRQVLKEKIISIESITQSDKTIFVNKNRLGQILLNFITNAAKYNRDGGTVTFGCIDTDDGELRIFVKDTGIGIHPEKEAKLFAPFVRGYNTSKDTSGAGLGLAICKQLTESMGGKIGYETTLGEGSTFWVQFPRYVAVQVN